VDTPDRAALHGFSQASEARVAASQVVGGYAAVYVVTCDRTGQADTLSILRREGSSWFELSAGSAGATWTAFLDDGSKEDQPTDDLGVLAYAGESAQPCVVDVELDGRVVKGFSFDDGRHWVALFVGVDANAMDRVRVETRIAGKGM